MKRFSVFGLILLVLFCFTGCSDDTSLESYVDEAEYVELAEGSWTVGEDIKPGRYQVGPSEASSYLIIHTDSNDAFHGGSLGESSAVDGYTTWLREGETVEVIGSSLSFSPRDVEEARANEALGAGCYVVGIDIPTGDYEMRSVNPEGPGQIYHYDRKGENLSQNELFDVIDADHDVGLNLQKGDRVIVSNVNQVVLEDV